MRPVGSVRHMKKPEIWNGLKPRNDVTDLYFWFLVILVFVEVISLFMKIFPFMWSQLDALNVGWLSSVTSIGVEGRRSLLSVRRCSSASYFVFLPDVVITCIQIYISLFIWLALLTSNLFCGNLRKWSEKMENLNTPKGLCMQAHG